MKLRAFFFLLLALGVTMRAPSSGLEAPSGSLSGSGHKPVATDSVVIESTQMVQKEGFGAQFWLVDSEEIFRSWMQADLNALESVRAARRGVPIYIALFFLEPGAESNRHGARSNVTYDYQVSKPDGSLFGSGKNFVAWSAAPPPPRIIQLATGGSQASHQDAMEAAHTDAAAGSLLRINSQLKRIAYPRIEFGEIDPSGEYNITVTVCDHVKKVELVLQRTVRVLD